MTSEDSEMSMILSMVADVDALHPNANGPPGQLPNSPSFTGNVGGLNVNSHLNMAGNIVDSTLYETRSDSNGSLDDPRGIHVPENEKGMYSIIYSMKIS